MVELHHSWMKVIARTLTNCFIFLKSCFAHFTYPLPISLIGCMRNQSSSPRWCANTKDSFWTCNQNFRHPVKPPSRRQHRDISAHAPNHPVGELWLQSYELYFFIKSVAVLIVVCKWPIVVDRSANELLTLSKAFGSSEPSIPAMSIVRSNQLGVSKWSTRGNSMDSQLRLYWSSCRGMLQSLEWQIQMGSKGSKMTWLNWMDCSWCLMIMQECARISLQWVIK